MPKKEHQPALITTKSRCYQRQFLLPPVRNLLRLIFIPYESEPRFPASQSALSRVRSFCAKWTSVIRLRSEPQVSLELDIAQQHTRNDSTRQALGLGSGSSRPEQQQHEGKWSLKIVYFVYLFHRQLLVMVPTGTYFASSCLRPVCNLYICRPPYICTWQNAATYIALRNATSQNAHNQCHEYYRHEAKPNSIKTLYTQSAKTDKKNYINQIKLIIALFIHDSYRGVNIKADAPN